MIRMSFEGTDVAALRVLERTGPEMRTALTAGITKATLQMQQHVQVDKLSGQVLHHRSGKLINSVRVIPVHQEGTALVGAVEAAGGPAFYGRVHEYGGTFTYVRPSKKHGSTQVTVHFPERSFMRTSIEELTPKIEAGLTDAVAEGVRNAAASGRTGND
jgi:phage gpG-like protein